MLNSIKKGWAEFREFAFKGNMIDLAIAVVIGGAFGGVIHSLVDDVIMPAVTYVTTTAQKATKAAAEEVKKESAIVGLTTQPSTQPSTAPSAPPTVAVTAPPPPAPPVAPTTTTPPADEKQVQLDWTIGPIQIGHFIAALINFMLIAFAVFLVMVKVLGSVVKRMSGPTSPSEPTTRECPYCLSNIPIKAKKCAHCTSEVPAVS